MFKTQQTFHYSYQTSILYLKKKLWKFSKLPFYFPPMLLFNVVSGDYIIFRTAIMLFFKVDLIAVLAQSTS